MELNLLDVRPKSLPLRVSLCFDGNQVPPISTDPSNGYISFKLDRSLFESGAMQHQLVLVQRHVHFVLLL